MFRLAQAHTFRKHNELMLSSATAICGIMAHTKDRAVASVGLPALRVAGECLTRPEEQMEILYLLDTIRNETGWRVSKWRNELMTFWSNNSQPADQTITIKASLGKTEDYSHMYFEEEKQESRDSASIGHKSQNLALSAIKASSSGGESQDFKKEYKMIQQTANDAVRLDSEGKFYESLEACAQTYKMLQNFLKKDINWSNLNIDRTSLEESVNSASWKILSSIELSKLEL